MDKAYLKVLSVWIVGFLLICSQFGQWKQSPPCSSNIQVSSSLFVRQFVQMMRTRTGEHLDAWLTQVQSSKLHELKPFAAGI